MRNPGIAYSTIFTRWDPRVEALIVVIRISPKLMVVHEVID
jgi:hypothetical protein